MGLSEQERKVLEELERGLYAEDAGFAQRISKTGSEVADQAVKSSAGNSTRLIAGALLAVVGISVLVVGAILQYVVFGIIGFAVMLWGLVLASSNWSSTSLQGRSAQSGKPSKDQTTGFFEERWNRRTGE